MKKTFSIVTLLFLTACSTAITVGLSGCASGKKLMKNCEASQDKMYWICEEP